MAKGAYAKKGAPPDKYIVTLFKSIKVPGSRLECSKPGSIYWNKDTGYGRNIEAV